MLGNALGGRGVRWGEGEGVIAGWSRTRAFRCVGTAFDKGATVFRGSQDRAQPSKRSMQSSMQAALIPLSLRPRPLHPP